MHEAMYFFGCGRGPGHFWHGPGLSHVDPYALEQRSPWKDYEIDAKLQPGCQTGRRFGQEHTETGPQRQGPARLHHRDGWTLLAFWDRSADDRYGCNGNFLAEGVHDFDAMMTLAGEHFPGVIARLIVPLRA